MPGIFLMYRRLLQDTKKLTSIEPNANLYEYILKETYFSKRKLLHSALFGILVMLKSDNPQLSRLRRGHDVVLFSQGRDHGYQSANPSLYYTVNDPILVKTSSVLPPLISSIYHIYLSHKFYT